MADDAHVPKRQLLDLVDTLVARGTALPTPVVTVWAPRGCGLAGMLEEIESAVSTTAPVAVIDGPRAGDVRPHELALLLTWQLGQRRSGFGRVTFPRFFLGLTAVRAREVQDRPDQARRELIGRIVRDRPELAKQLGTTAAMLATTLGSADIGSSADAAVRAIFPAVNRFATLRAARASWYRTALPGAPRTSVDALVELARREREGEREQVEAVLCAAFTADLDAALGSRWRFLAAAHRPLVLVPESGPGVLRFLDALEARPVDDRGGSVLVVAASDRRSDGRDVAAQDWVTAPLAEASPAHWRENRTRPGWRHRYPLRAGTDLPSGHASGLPTPESRVAEFARGLAHGHLGGVAAVHRALPPGRAATADLRRVFAEVGPGGRALDDEVLDLVLRTWSADLRRAVVRLALLRDLRPDRLDPVLRGESEEVALELRQFLKQDMWILREPGVEPRLHPYARRAVAHRVGRNPVAGVVWTSWHDTLHNEAHGRASERVTAHYHQVAVGRLAPVAEDLAGALTGTDPAPAVDEWYAHLLAVTAAPVARPGQGTDSEADAHQAVAAGGRTKQDTVRPRLLAALQRHTDPLGDPQHRLCRTVAEELAHVALSPAIRGGADYLLARAEEFRDCARRTGKAER